MRVWSGLFFIREMLAFQKIPPDSSPSPDLSARVARLDVLDVVQGAPGYGFLLFEGACLGAASSSCPYAAVAIARSAFRKGAELHSRHRGVRTLSTRAKGGLVSAGTGTVQQLFDTADTGRNASLRL